LQSSALFEGQCRLIGFRGQWRGRRSNLEGEQV